MVYRAPRKRSKKREKEDPEYARFKTRIIAQRGVLCEATLWEHECWGQLDLHHILPRGRGGKRMDESNVIVVCRRAHDFIGDQPVRAKALGLLR